jgi:biofilm PGA synthesis protein PgaA
LEGAAVVVVCAVALLASIVAASAMSPREAAVLEARAGHLDSAIAALRRLLDQGSQDPLVAMDLAVLLHQAGQAQAATDVFERARMANPPEYALLDMTRAYRDQRRFEAAERLARQGMRRFPGNPDWPVLLALVLADSGRGEEALDVLRNSAASRANPVERLLAEAYALRQARRPWEALRAYAEAVRREPGNRYVRAEMAALLRELGGPNGAAALVDAPPPIATGADRLPLAADQAAAAVRWGSAIRPADPVRRFEGTDAALAKLDALISATRAESGADPGLLTRLRFDRLVALRDRRRMAEVVAEADALRAEGYELPPYALEAQADALLYLHRPKEARAAYEAVLAADPANKDARYGLFYAQVETEDFDAAYATIDSLAAAEPVWRTFEDDPTRYPNPDFTDAALTAGLARFYGDQLGDALDRIAPLASAAPANASARLAQAEVMAARGWPRQALSEAEIAASLAPNDPYVQQTLAGLAMERHRLSEAAARIEALQVLYPEDLNVRRLAEELAAERSPLLEIEVRPAWTQGGGANASGQELELSSRLFSAPIADSWRLFALDDYAYAHPPEGFVDRNRSGAGVELRLPDLAATLYATVSTGTLTRGGGGFTVDWWADDHLQLGAAGELFSIDTPLRALLQGVTAHEISASATYRWHESREVSISAAFLPFTDDNRRVVGALNFAQRLIDIPHFDLTGRIDVSGSGNTRSDVAYYSPRADLSATGGLLAEHVLWRRYDNSLVQALTVDAGLYAERGFATDWIGSVSYEHRWRFDPWTEFHYGVVLSRNVFDGDPEEAFALLFGLRQRL